METYEIKKDIFLDIKEDIVNLNEILMIYTTKVKEENNKKVIVFYFKNTKELWVDYSKEEYSRLLKVMSHNGLLVHEPDKDVCN